MRRILMIFTFSGAVALAMQHLWSTSFAAGLTYTCQVLEVYSLANGGRLEARGGEGRFTVSRRDGQILGEVLPTLMADKVTVLSPGDGRNSFRSFAFFNMGQAGPSVQTLDVQEFRSGKQKPFVSFSMGGAGIVTGVCE